MKYKVGDRVQKVKGYRFPGVIVSSFYSVAGEVRYVVEATEASYQGMLHIFNEEQLTHV